MKPTGELSKGAVFARDFQIIERIAEGGMGVVYEALQLSTRKHRALKLMNASMLRDERQRERFLQEAYISSQLESEHIVEVVSAGIDEATGMPWLAMELLRGETLERRVIERGPFGEADLFELSQQLRHVLGQAHRMGLVHRDLKPENIFISSPRRSNVPFTAKVLDFGISKWVQEARNAANSQVIGSPLWMAPEQWQPRAQIGPATDVWALGLVIYYAITGRLFWRSAGLDDVSAMIVEIVSMPIDAPSQRAREQGSNAEITPSFDEWFLHCVARNAGERFANASHALLAFESLFDGPASMRSAHPMRWVPPASLGSQQTSVLDPAAAPAGAPPVHVHPDAQLDAPSERPRSTLEPQSRTVVERLADEGKGRGAFALATALACRTSELPAPVAALLDQRRSTPLTKTLPEATWLTSLLPRDPPHGGLLEAARILSPLVAQAVAIAPELAGLTDADRLMMQPELTPQLALAQQTLVKAGALFGLRHAPRIYVRATQTELLRLEPTDPLATVFGRAAPELDPDDLVFAVARHVAYHHDELRLRVLLPDPAALAKLFAGVRLMLERDRPVGAARSLMLTVLRERLVRSSSLRESLTRALEGTTDEQAPAAWLAMDKAAARAALLFSGDARVARRALSLPVGVGGLSPEATLFEDLLTWAETQPPFDPPGVAYA